MNVQNKFPKKHGGAAALAFYMLASGAVGSAFGGVYLNGKTVRESNSSAQVQIIQYEWGAAQSQDYDRIQFRFETALPSNVSYYDSIRILLRKVGLGNKPQGCMELDVPYRELRYLRKNETKWFYCDFPKIQGVTMMWIENVTLQSGIKSTQLKYLIKNNADNRIMRGSVGLNKLNTIEINYSDLPAEPAAEPASEPTTEPTVAPAPKPAPAPTAEKYRLVWADSGFSDEYESLADARAKFQEYPSAQIFEKPIAWDVSIKNNAGGEQRLARIEPLASAATGGTLSPVLPSAPYRIIWIENGKEQKCANITSAINEVRKKHAPEQLVNKQIAVDIYSKTANVEKHIARIEPLPASALAAMEQ